MTPAHRPATTHWTLLGVVALVVLVVDQLTKWWALQALADGPIDLVGSLRLNLVFNFGSAFSLGGGRGWGPIVSVVSLVVVVGVLWMARSGTSRIAAIAIGLIVGGAVGNLVDRAARSSDGFLGGGVVDFVDLQWWPVFNVADAAIVVGVIGLLAATLWGSGTDGEPVPSGASPSASGGVGGA